MEKNVALFEKKQVRRVWHEGQWWFVITDVIVALTDSINPSDYFKKLRKRDLELGKLYTKGGGKLYPPLLSSFKQPEVFKNYFVAHFDYACRGNNYKTS